MRCASALLAVTLVAACASHPPHNGGSGTGTSTGTGTGTSAATVDAAPAVAPADAAAAAPLTRAECDKLIDHVLKVALASMSKKLTDDQVAAARDKLSTEMMPQCLAWDRASYDCALAANDRDAMNACAGSH